MATQPKLAMIPSGYKDGKLYSALPTDGAGDFDITRGSDARRINKDGLIEVVTGNTPRLDYTGGGCPSLLLEPQSTNLLTYSEGFSNAYWSKFGTNFTITDNNSISPSGELNASTLNVSNADNELYNALSFSSTSGVWTFSIYAKGSGTFDMKIRLAGSAATAQTMTLTSDWQRFDVTSIYGTSKTSVESFISFNNIVNMDIFGAQTEQSSYATSYIPTSGSAQTRLADAANGAGDSSTFNDSEGVLMLDISAFAETNYFEAISLNDGTAANRVFIGLYAGNLYITVVKASVATFDVNTPITVTNSNKIVVNYKQSDFSLWLNGVEIVSSVGINGGGTPLGLSKISFDRGDGVENFYGNTKQIQYYNTALTDLEIETLTSYTSFNAMALALNYTI